MKAAGWQKKRQHTFFFIKDEGRMEIVEKREAGDNKTPQSNQLRNKEKERVQAKRERERYNDDNNKKKMWNTRAHTI